MVVYRPTPVSDQPLFEYLGSYVASFVGRNRDTLNLLQGPEYRYTPFWPLDTIEEELELNKRDGGLHQKEVDFVNGWVDYLRQCFNKAGFDKATASAQEKSCAFATLLYLLHWDEHDHPPARNVFQAHKREEHDPNRLEHSERLIRMTVSLSAGGVLLRSPGISQTVR